jgi:hypothetical protein
MPNLRMAVGARRTLMLNTVIVRAFWATVLARRLSRRAYSRAGYLVPAVGIAGIAAWLVEVASQFREAGRPYLNARVSFAALQIGWFCVTARLDVRKFFCLIEVPAQSFAKLQPSSPGSRLNRRHTQVQRSCRLLQ